MLNSQIKLWRTDTFTILNLSIHEHGVSFHLFTSPLIYLSEFSNFPHIDFVYICKIYFNLNWGPNVHGVVLLISNSTCLMLVYGKEIDVCKLILYPINLLSSLINSRRFWLILPKFLYRWTFHLWKRYFIFFLLIYIAFFSCFITLARISS